MCGVEGAERFVGTDEDAVGGEVCEVEAVDAGEGFISSFSFRKRAIISFFSVGDAEGSLAISAFCSSICCCKSFCFAASDAAADDDAEGVRETDGAGAVGMRGAVEPSEGAVDGAG